MALVTNSLVGMVLALAAPPMFAVGVVAVVVPANRRFGPLVPPELQGIDPQDRRIVSAAVSGGGRVADPELARRSLLTPDASRSSTACFWPAERSQ